MATIKQILAEAKKRDEKQKQADAKLVPPTPIISKPASPKESSTPTKTIMQIPLQAQTNIPTNRVGKYGEEAMGALLLRSQKTPEQLAFQQKEFAKEVSVLPRTPIAGLAKFSLGIAKAVPAVVASSLAEGGTSKRYEEANKYTAKPVSAEQMKKAQEIAGFASKISYPGTAIDEFIAKTEKDLQALETPGSRLFGQTLMAAGQMAPVIATGGIAGAGAGLATLGAGVYGQSFGEAVERGSDVKTAGQYAALSSALELATETLVGGIPGLGKGLLSKIIQTPSAVNLASRIGVKSASNVFAKTASAVGKTLSSKGGRLLVNAFGEGIEEVIAEYLAPSIERSTIDPNAPDATVSELAESFAVGGLLSALLGVPSITLSTGKTVTKLDDVDNLTKPETREFEDELYRLTRESNIRKGKITPQGELIQAESAEVMATQRGLPTPQTKPVENKTISEKAKKEFGVTSNPLEAGYILSDGQMLDFSGKKDGGESNVRNMDHREIQELYEDKQQTDAMNQFILDTGSVRISVDAQGDFTADISGTIPLTEKQIERIKKLSAKKQYVTIDYYESPLQNNPTESFELDFPTVKQVDDVINKTQKTSTTQPAFEPPNRPVEQRIPKSRVDIPQAPKPSLKSSITHSAGRDFSVRVGEDGELVLKETKPQEEVTKSIDTGSPVDEFVTGIVDELKSSTRKSKEYGIGRSIWSFLAGKEASTPKLLFLEMGNGDKNSYSYKIFKSLRDAENKELNTKHRLEAYINNGIGRYKILKNDKAWTEKKDVNGRMLSSGEKVWLKAASKDDNIMSSLEQRGYVGGKSTIPHRITKAEIDSIQLTAKEQALLDKMPDFFEQTYNLLNEEYVKLTGETLERSPYGEYFPKKVSDISVEDSLSQVFKDPSLKNVGVTINRKGTVDVVVMEDITKTIERHIAIATKYNAYVNTLDDLNKIILDPRLKSAFRESYGAVKPKEGVTSQTPSIIEDYVRKLAQDLQGTGYKKSGIAEQTVKKLRMNAIPAILAFRLTTPLIQTMSYPIVLGDISAKNLLLGLSKKANYAEMFEYNARAKERQNGHIDRDIVESKQNPLAQIGMKPIAFMDMLTIGKLWEATKLEVAETIDPNSPNYMQEVSRKFDDILDSQPNYTPLERSGSLRSTGEIEKALTMFGSAKSAAFNELKKGYVVGKNTGDWSLMSKKIAGYIGSVLGMAFIRGSIKRLDDDDDTATEILVNTAMSSLPVTNVISTVINGYDVGIIGLDSINDFSKTISSNMNLVEKLVRNEDEITEREVVKAFWNTVDSAAMLLGVPEKNLREDIALALNVAELDATFRRFTDPYTSKELYSKLEEAIKAGKPINKLLQQQTVKDETIIKNLKPNLTLPQYRELVVELKKNPN